MYPKELQDLEKICFTVNQCPVTLDKFLGGSWLAILPQDNWQQKFA